MKEKINLRQFLLFLFLFSIGTSIILSPSNLANTALGDAWISMLFAMGFGSLMVLAFFFISRLYPNHTLVDMNKAVFGKWIGLIFSLFFVGFGLLSSASVLWTIGHFMITQILHETPQPFIHILFMAVVIYGVHLGIETIARAGELFFPWVIVLLLMVILFSLPSIQLDYIKPIFSTDLATIIKGGWFELSVSTFPLVVLFMIFPKYVQEKQAVGRKIVVAYILGMTMITAATFVTTTSLGVQFTSHHIYPTYILAKSLNIEGLIQRVEVIIAVSWILTIFFKLSLYFYATVTAIAQIVKVQNYRSLSFPFGVVTIAMSLTIYPNSVFASEWNTTTWIYFSTTAGLVYPCLILFTTMIKKVFKRKQERSS